METETSLSICCYSVPLTENDGEQPPAPPLLPSASSTTPAWSPLLRRETQLLPVRSGKLPASLKNYHTLLLLWAGAKGALEVRRGSNW